MNLVMAVFHSKNRHGYMTTKIRRLHFVDIPCLVHTVEIDRHNGIFHLAKAGLAIGHLIDDPKGSQDGCRAGLFKSVNLTGRKGKIGRADYSTSMLHNAKYAKHHLTATEDKVPEKLTQINFLFGKKMILINCTLFGVY